MTTLQLAVFLLASAGIIYVSRASLRQPRAHGFYRFWAWEAILALARVASAGLVSRAAGLASDHLVAAADPLPCSAGARPAAVAPGQTGTRERADAALLGFEKTAELVTTGVYRYIRHPMYSSLLLLAWGVFFKAPSWPGILLGAAATGCLVATAKVEEQENVRFFGPSYESYMKQTRMFIPFVALAAREIAMTPEIKRQDQ